MVATIDVVDAESEKVVIKERKTSFELV